VPASYTSGYTKNLIDIFLIHAVIVYALYELSANRNILSINWSKKNTDRKIRIIPTDLPRFTSLRYIIIKIIIKFKNMANMSFHMIRLR
jgi:hypothetical protein